MFHSQSPQMVFSAYQLTKEPSVLIGQADVQCLGCLSVSVCPTCDCVARVCLETNVCQLR